MARINNNLPKCCNTSCSVFLGGQGCDLGFNCIFYKPMTKSQEKAIKTAKKEYTKQQEKTSKIRPLESEEQKAVIDYCNLYKIPVIHIANEGKRSYRAGQELKRQGLQKGIPDLFIPQAKKDYYGLFIEMKRDDKAKASVEQKQWVENLNQFGYLAVICYGADEAIDTIKNYFNIS